MYAIIFRHWHRDLITFAVEFGVWSLSHLGYRLVLSLLGSRFFEFKLGRWNTAHLLERREDTALTVSRLFEDAGSPSSPEVFNVTGSIPRLNLESWGLILLCVVKKAGRWQLALALALGVDVNWIHDLWLDVKRFHKVVWVHFRWSSWVQDRHVCVFVEVTSQVEGRSWRLVGPGRGYLSLWFHLYLLLWRASALARLWLHRWVCQLASVDFGQHMLWDSLKVEMMVAGVVEDLVCIFAVDHYEDIRVAASD